MSDTDNDNLVIDDQISNPSNNHEVSKERDLDDIFNADDETVESQDNGWQLPPLFHLNKREVRVYVIGFDGKQSLVSSWGNLQAYQNGHMQTSYIDVTLNTSGRNYHEQALLDAKSRWNRKSEFGYRETVIEKSIYECEAMLATDFTEKCLKASDFPVYVQPKLDGTRCRADDYSPVNDIVDDTGIDNTTVVITNNVVRNNNNTTTTTDSDDGKTTPTINLISRGAQVINYFDHIRQQLIPVFEEAKAVMAEWWPDKPAMLRLDGELFTFDKEIDFDKLSGATRLQNYRSQYEQRVDYYIFDVDFAFDVPYPERWSFLHQVFSNLIVTNSTNGVDNAVNTNDEVIKSRNSRTIRLGNLLMVMSYEAYDNEDIFDLQAEFEQEGYEGAIIRRTGGPCSYYFHGRCTHMYKLKSFCDAEFMVVNGGTARGREKGCIMWILKTPDGKTFKVRPCGSLEERKRVFLDFQQSPELYKGQLYRVRFQDYTKTGIPRFPRGVGFVYDRDAAEVGY